MMTTKTLHILLVILILIIGFKQSRHEYDEKVKDIQTKDFNTYVETSPQDVYAPRSSGVENSANEENSTQHIQVERCTDLAEHQNYQVLAASVYEGKSNLNLPSEYAGYHLVDVELILTKPTILILTGYEQNVWNIRESTKGLLKEVLLSGYEAQKVILNGSQAKVFGGQSSKCNGSYYDEKEIDSLNAYSQNRIGKTVHALYLQQGQDTLQIDDRQIKPLQEQLKTQLQSKKNHFVPAVSDDYYMTLPDGDAGMQKALELGLIRPATRRDAEEFDLANIRLSQNKTRVDQAVIVGQEAHLRHTFYGHDGYVILKPFQFPAEMYGAHSATFYLAKGVPYPKGELSHSTLYNINDGTCRGAGCGH